MNKLSTIEQNVAKLLTRQENCRDSDDRLVSTYWYVYDNASIYFEGLEILKAFADSKFTSPESITRARRKLQHSRPELRGKKYKYRMAKQADYREYAAS
jgi:hypothetical protein